MRGIVIGLAVLGAFWLIAGGFTLAYLVREFHRRGWLKRDAW